jgi:hypothetical protein
VATLSPPGRDRLFEGAAALSKPLFSPTDARAASADSSFSILHGLYWLLSNLANEAPVALSVDDLHWSDTESLRFLNYLAPRLDGLPVAVLASARGGASAPSDLARLAAGPETTLLRPAPLSVEATAVLCEQRLGAPVADEFARACHEATGGNPFFLEALLREAGERGFSTRSPEGIRVARRGSQLPHRRHRAAAHGGRAAQLRGRRGARPERADRGHRATRQAARAARRGSRHRRRCCAGCGGARREHGT